MKTREEPQMKKRSMIIAVAALLLLAGVACAQQPPAGSASDATEAPQLELTLEELAAYDGKDGNPAYVAVDGIIYDMSGSAKWKNGEHNGYSAGQDLTDMIKNKSPHGISMLSRVPVVGKIVD